MKNSAERRHIEAFVKVNARVDRGIANFVSALSSIRGLETFSSCQGDVGLREAHVAFRVGGWKKTGSLLFDQLLPLLGPDLMAAVKLEITAYDSDNAIGWIRFDPRVGAKLLAKVKEIQPP